MLYSAERCDYFPFKVNVRLNLSLRQSKVQTLTYSEAVNDLHCEEALLLSSLQKVVSMSVTKKKKQHDNM